MKVNVYAQIKESPSSGYITVEDMIMETGIEDKYKQIKENYKNFGETSKMEILEGFKLQYVLVEVEYNRRKKSIKQDDVLKSLEKKKLVVKVGECIFGGFYLLTDELRNILEDQLNQRKELVKKGLYETIA
jgi:hypothetical protein